ncbi:MAG: hypothetical protein OH338_01655 [Candidatus Parvarchaeota archaeon]|nr:hypothetical protein [Candidatus Parvarchaeota archaeon]MCW1294404.1 hypothetical protein [Candidatus Parvarchaeum tengchongense]MCW1295143.1 hypothetical protein [Candidatus Parvarchaeum tengchongense]MCW1299584.1 hypothetical protein [Candidatus Parvarchaeum tengchongense]MCW1312120.1 hypothetical protein [Candidatus Parvarchaeum tengchongense]
MKKGQVFTIDLVVGSIIILSVIASAYAITSYYLTLNSSITTNNDFLSQIYSAVSSFSVVSSTTNQLLLFQNGGSVSTLNSYISSVLNPEISSPFLLEVFTKSNYSNNDTPSNLIFSYNSRFSPSSSYSTFYQPLLITNYSSACGSSCNSSLSIKSVFPSYNDTINAPDCNVLYGNGTVTGWTILNDTPSGYCTVLVPSYADPNSYDVVTSSSTGISTGSATLHILALDLLKFEVQK